MQACPWRSGCAVYPPAGSATWQAYPLPGASRRFACEAACHPPAFRPPQPRADQRISAAGKGAAAKLSTHQKEEYGLGFDDDGDHGIVVVGASVVPLTAAQREELGEPAAGGSGIPVGLQQRCREALLRRAACCVHSCPLRPCCALHRGTGSPQSRKLLNHLGWRSSTTALAWPAGPLAPAEKEVEEAAQEELKQRFRARGRKKGAAKQVGAASTERSAWIPD